MSKSTPISNLPNLKKQTGPAFEQRENEIVKEILNEIDSDKNPAPTPPQPAGPTPEQIQMMQQQQQAMVEQQMREQQMMEQQMLEQQMAAKLQQEQMKPAEVNKIVNSTPKSFVEQLLETAKPSLLVAVIVAVVSLPFLGNLIKKVVASKESLAKFEMPLTLIIKGLLGGAMFYGGSNALEL